MEVIILLIYNKIKTMETELLSNLSDDSDDDDDYCPDCGEYWINCICDNEEDDEDFFNNGDSI
jgi:hypothetical protein